MSGGHWGYRDQIELDNGDVNIYNLPKILEALKKVLHIIDYDISGDSSRLSRNVKDEYDETTRSASEKEVYDLMEKQFKGKKIKITVEKYE